MTKVVIYTDGSCLERRYGGYGFVVLENNDDKNTITEWHVSGGIDNTTNNRMELIAVIEGLKFSENRVYDKYCIYSDSQYVIKCAKGDFKRNKNLDLWKVYDKVCKNKNIEWTWVKGHSGDKYNNIVDCLAKQEAKIIQNKNN